jgi:hydroxymethylpyrimidine/phosphomethylpyrimidine kinase
VTWAAVREAVAARDPQRIGYCSGRAAVAILLRESPDGIGVLFIHRSEHPQDPWSGHMAFPGGRAEEGEEPLATAVREVQEEVGIDLRQAELLGALDELQAVRRVPVDLAIAPFVFRLPEGMEPSPGEEVRALCWVSLDDLLGDRYRGIFDYQGGKRPALPVFPGGGQGDLGPHLSHVRRSGRAHAGRTAGAGPVKVALTIAGSDSGGGAGIQADLLTFAAHGVHGTCAITAVTAQNSVEVRDYVALPPEMVVKQIDAVADDMPVAAAKTGMLASAAIVSAVAACLRRRSLPALVVDPVMVAKGGHRLLDPAAERAYLTELLPLATVITPNIPEAEALLSCRIGSVADMKEAARELLRRGARAVVVKGGHLPGDAVDVFAAGERLDTLSAARIPTAHTHGTGCTFAAAIAARLAQGSELPEAVSQAKTYLTRAIAGAYGVGRGHGPVDHLHPLRAAKE